MTELPKTFEPGPIEARWYAHWEDQGLFRPERKDAEPFTIVMPPPNVTGSLHIGHALDNTLQDILTRRARMEGKDALWVVGTDHAGIATQMVVERQLGDKQQKRTDFNRDAFVAKVWEWKHESGGQITRQLRRLGASCDWKNERFTMDPGFSAAVTKVFVELHKRGLLYRDKRLVNWDPKFQTAISDLEVETNEVPGKFWTLRYPLADGSGHVEVATTRPETMLADMAVAVHPEDARYRDLVGKQVRLPITGRLIPIITDEHADPELGSGAVKITPGHDFNDFEVGKRAGIKPADMLNMLDGSAHICQTQDGLVPDELLGRERFDARKRVVELLDREGALVKVEDRVIATPYGDRSGVVIEPWLTDQWYVDVKPLAERAIAATRSGEIRIVPETWSKTWYNWLEGIQPWCVSRQLWWGHRIPAWFDEDGNMFVAETEDEARAQAGNRALRQDEDVLDTWFSSALWPFATLGWPEQTEDLKRHYPNDVLISGFDILFFWDARMAMQGLEFMGEVPWRTLYLHGLVRDAHGQKMSKSKGNTVDPLGLIDRYGADALRFTLAAMESQGRDIKLDEKRVEGYRNFATKLWNAARFLQMNGVGASTSIEAPPATLPVNRWIIGEVVETLGKLNRAFDELRFDGMADAIYHFTWGTFCDWYVELIKPELAHGGHAGSAEASGNTLRQAQGERGVLDSGARSALAGSAEALDNTLRQAQGERESAAAETRAVAAWAFDQILVMLHPFMPFVTEELWHAMGERPYDLIVAKWPEPQAAVDDVATTDVRALIEIINDIRTQRLETGFNPADVIPVAVLRGDDAQIALLNRFADVLRRIARVRPADIGIAHSDGVTMGSVELVDAYQIADAEETSFVSAQFILRDMTLLASTRGFIDLDAERARLGKAVAAAEKDRDSLAARLDNRSFMERAKPEAIEKARADHGARAAEAERLRAALERLG